MEKLAYIAGGSLKWYSHSGKQFGYFLKKLNLNLSHDPAIPLPGNISKRDETYPHKDLLMNVYSSSFIHNTPNEETILMFIKG